LTAPKAKRNIHPAGEVERLPPYIDGQLVCLQLLLIQHHFYSPLEDQLLRGLYPARHAGRETASPDGHQLKGFLHGHITRLPVENDLAAMNLQGFLLLCEYHNRGVAGESCVAQVSAYFDAVSAYFGLRLALVAQNDADPLKSDPSRR
jgi:hypothetical protein